MEEEKSYQEIRKILVKKYKTEVIPKIKELESLREKVLQKHEKIIKINSKFKENNTLLIGCFLPLLIPISGLMILFFSLIGIKSVWVIGLPFFITVILFSIFMLKTEYYAKNHYMYMPDYKKDKKTFQREIKKRIMPIFCSCFPDLKWVPDRKHQTEIYKKLDLLYRYDNICYDDCFEGKHSGVKFIIEETNSQIIIQFKISKKFKGHTVIICNGEYFSNDKLHIAKFEDIVFENNYDVYTNDDVEARYLITPSLMKRINDIQLKFDGTIVKVVFYCGVLYLSLNYDYNLFDYGSANNSLNDPKPFIKMSEEIISILKLIDHFKLDQNIGM